jgi:transcriptional regulator with XRE-family HTH domain
MSDDLPAALRLARRAVGLTQRQLAEQIPTALRTIVRWETGRAFPQFQSRDRLVGWLQQHEDKEAVRDALIALAAPLAGDDSTPAATPPPVARVLSPEERERVRHELDYALLTAAEESGVSARGARRVVIAVLGAIEARDVPVGVARELVTKRAEKAPAKDGEPAG